MSYTVETLVNFVKNADALAPNVKVSENQNFSWQNIIERITQGSSFII